MSLDNNSRGFGWIPDLPDHRDIYLMVDPRLLQQLPAAVDLRTQEAMKFPIFDQGNLGSCTANAISAAIAYAYYKQSLTQQAQIAPAAQNPFFIASRLFIYYNERVMLNTVNSDSGAILRDGIKSVNRKGAAKETTWPYIPQQFTTKPSQTAYQEAQNYQAIQYRRIDNTDLNAVKGCLAQGFPFVFGFTVYQSFMTQKVAQTGMMPMPSKGERVLGGHAVLGVGYDDTTRTITVRNSWGPGWGDKGYFYMPYDYVTNPDLSVDYWTITMMEAEKKV